MKGLPRSLSRGAATQQEIFRQNYPFNVTFTVLNGTANPGIGSVVIGDFPSGNIYLMCSRMMGLIFTTADADATATWDGDWAVGSAPNTDADLTDGTDFDINGVSGGQAIGPATAKVSPTQDVSSAKAAIIVNTDGSKEINLNVMVDDASQAGDITMVARGVLELVFVVL